MTGLSEHLDNYIQVRRAVGFRLDRPELLLIEFIDHLETRRLGIVTVDAAIDWAGLPPNPDSSRGFGG